MISWQVASAASAYSTGFGALSLPPRAGGSSTSTENSRMLTVRCNPFLPRLATQNRTVAWASSLASAERVSENSFENVTIDSSFRASRTRGSSTGRALPDADDHGRFCRSRAFASKQDRFVSEHIRRRSIDSPTISFAR